MKKVKHSPASVKRATTEIRSYNVSRELIWVLIIPVIIFIVYRSVLDFSLVNWDDKKYVEETPMVRGLTGDNIEKMFTTKVLRSYNPLVLLSFAIDFEISGLKPEWCHGVNLFFHILNALLVFICMKKMRFKTEASGLIALLFAVHPLAVEAVAWIAGRKDVLYAFFYLLAWICYLNFRNTNKKSQYFISLLFFLLSLLSKVQAITLPFVLIISDYIITSKFERKSLLNKIPFVLLSLLFGLIAINGSSFVADKYVLPPTFSEKIIYSVMAFGLYFMKAIIPVFQSCIYSFPESGSGEYFKLLIPGFIVLFGVLSLIIYSFKKSPVFAGGLLIFSVSIFVVLHIVAFNSSLIYERFSYLASLGLFISVLHINTLFPYWQKIRLRTLAVIILCFCVLTNARAKIWVNTETMWSDVILKNPNAAEAYNNRGMVYLDRNEFDLAFADFNECIRLRPQLPDGFNNRSVIYFKQKKYAEALKDNDEVMRIDPEFPDGLTNRGCFFYTMENYDSAIVYYSKASKIKPRDASTYFFCGTSYYNKGDFTNAIKKLREALIVYPQYADAHTYMGMAYVNLDKMDLALMCVVNAENSIANSAARKMISDEYIRLGNKVFEKGNGQLALSYYINASRIKPDNAEAYFNLGGMAYTKKNIVQAREYWGKTVSLDSSHIAAKEWLARIGS